MFPEFPNEVESMKVQERQFSQNCVPGNSAQKEKLQPIRNSGIIIMNYRLHSFQRLFCLIREKKTVTVLT